MSNAARSRSWNGALKNLGKDVRFNLMFQYFPEYRAMMFPEINRMLTDAEIKRAKDIVKEAGLTNLV